VNHERDARATLKFRPPVDIFVCDGPAASLAFD